MIRLGVGLGAVAAVRAALGGVEPDLAAAAHACGLGGADHLVLRLRTQGPVRPEDVARVCGGGGLPVWLAIEPTPELVATAGREGVAGAILLPGASGGADLERAATTLRDAGRAVSVVVEPNEGALMAATGAGIEQVVLATEAFATARREDARVEAFRALARTASTARALMLRVTAGGGLDLLQAARVATLPEVEAVLVGRAIAARAMFEGLARATEAFSRRLGAVLPEESA